MTTHKNIILLTIFLLLPLSTSAATISFRAPPITLGVNDAVQVTVLLDSAIAANAFSGALVYSPTALEPIAVSDGNSIVSMWITRPVASGTPIIFAGITPGGFSGNRGVLFSIIFRTKTAGRVNISIRNMKVLRNDSVGGNEPTATRPLVLIVGRTSQGGYTEPIDRTPPEPFTLHFGNDQQLFNGKNYLSFTTADKGSGVSHYVVTESYIPSFLWAFFPPTWHTVTSPYVLVNQNLTSITYLKALDRAGNERLGTLPPPRLFSMNEKVTLWSVLMKVISLFGL